MKNKLHRKLWAKRTFVIVVHQMVHISFGCVSHFAYLWWGSLAFRANDFWLALIFEKKKVRLTCRKWQHQCKNARNHNATSNIDVVLNDRTQKSYAFWKKNESKKIKELLPSGKWLSGSNQSMMSISIYIFRKKRRKKCISPIVVVVFPSRWLIDKRVCIAHTSYFVHIFTLRFKWANFMFGRCFFLHLFFFLNLNLDKCLLLDAMCHSWKLQTGREGAESQKDREMKRELLSLRSLIMLLF